MAKQQFRRMRDILYGGACVFLQGVSRCSGRRGRQRVPGVQATTRLAGLNGNTFFTEIQITR